MFFRTFAVVLRYQTTQDHNIIFIYFMYKSLFNKRTPLVFKHFSNKGYSLFACLGREVIVSVLSVSTLSHAAASSLSVELEKADSTHEEMTGIVMDDVEVTTSRAPLGIGQAARMVTVLNRSDITKC